MGKNKLKKFKDLEGFRRVLQYPREALLENGFPYKGRWRKDVFANASPIILELGCGKGEYTVELAKANEAKNYIGIDIKGARLWTGAKEINEKNILNAAFLRTEIENIASFFSPGEVDEIWITFPDPQMQKQRKRLTSTRFLNEYGKFLKLGSIIHLKTDSPFLFEYTRRLVESNGFQVKELTDDLYGSGKADPEKSIKTFYESQWLSRGKKIKYISFVPDFANELKEPDDSDIEKDDYKSVTRHSNLLNLD